MRKSSTFTMSKRAQRLSAGKRVPKGEDGLKVSSKLQKDPPNGRKTDSIQRLGITPEQMVRYPNVSDIFKRTIGSREKILNMVRFSVDPSVESFLDVFDRIPTGDQPHIPFEAVCIKGNVNAAQFVGAVTMIAKQVMGDESRLELMMSHPEVVKKTIKFATTLPGASMDRKMLHDAAEFIPQKSGIAVNVQQNNVDKVGIGPSARTSPAPLQELTATTQHALPEPRQQPAQAFTTAFPSIDKKLEAWGARRRELIEKSRSVPFAPTEVIEGEYSDETEE